MLSIQGNVSSKQDIIFHIKEANLSQSINVITHSAKENIICFLFLHRKEEGGYPFFGARRGLRNSISTTERNNFLFFSTPMAGSPSLFHGIEF
jgi:hypothetical protein